MDICQSTILKPLSDHSAPHMNQQLMQRGPIEGQVLGPLIAELQEPKRTPDDDVRRMTATYPPTRIINTNKSILFNHGVAAPPTPAT